jgi:hypothetical protein
MAEDDLGGGDVAVLVLGAALEDPPRGGLVDEVGAAQVLPVQGQQVRLEDAVHAGQPLHGLPWVVRTLQRVHHPRQRRAGRRRGLRPLAQLEQAPAEQVRVLGVVPDVAPEQELGRDLRGQGDPTAQDAHEALDRVAVVGHHSRRVLDGEVAGERTLH